MSIYRWMGSSAAAVLCMLAVQASEPAAPFTVPEPVRAALSKYCVDCHGPEQSKGNLRFDTLQTQGVQPRIDALVRAQEQLFLHMMPPEGEEAPGAADRKLLDGWMSATLRSAGVADVYDKMRMPERGNWLDHQPLFSGEIKDKPFSPARRWLISPQIYTQRVLEVFNIYGEKERDGAHWGGAFKGITNPFLLPDRAGVRYFDLGVADGGHFLTLRTNAEWIAKKLVTAARIKAGELNAKEPENKMDRWVPKTVNPAFVTIVAKKEAPTDAEIAAAITAQFQAAYQRVPSAGELKDYTELTRNAVSTAGNAGGLQQMLMAVLLRSEFVYRSELGEGKPDEHGRRMLSPREGSFAIAYALSDDSPDPALRQAAESGKLNSKADYEREVRRILADKVSFKGAADPSITGKNVKSIVVSHPKIQRFFREFFGYPQAEKIFKDVNRSDGFYDNAGRGSSGTGGVLINEADMLVDYYLKQDKNVFENLLTTDTYYVAPIADAQAKIDALNQVYERYKAINWKLKGKTDKIQPPLSEDDLKFLGKTLGYRAADRQLSTAMTHYEKFKEKGLPPNPDWDYAFGTKLMLWTNAYNIDAFNWEYAVKQPFVLPQRKGILSHPAWLIAFSLNTETDPVRRGRWIREKLLAGRVPEVPITVDAKVPEDPHKGLRERLHQVTSKAECWKCHVFMNPLGEPFEAFDDFGRYRTQEKLEHPENLIAKAKTKYGSDQYKTIPVQTSGVLAGTGDPKLDGPVANHMEMIDRLAKSERVRQSIIRHAFRYFMGRNETLSDSQTLIDADNAYVRSGGSFNEVIVSLLTSDSFMYRR